MMVTCENCKKEFKATRPWAKFCKESCRNEFHNTKGAKRIVIKCPHCTNDNPKLMELIGNSLYLCAVCAREFHHES